MVFTFRIFVYAVMIHIGYCSECAENTLLGEVCDCGSIECKPAQYCLTPNTGDTKYCSYFQKCVSTDGTTESKTQCSCADASGDDDGQKTCDANRPVCKQDGTCAPAKCGVASGPSSDIYGCTCDDKTCEKGEFCFLPPVRIHSNPTGCVSQRPAACSNIDGREVNDDGAVCVCGFDDNKVYCDEQEYCNAALSQCSTTPNPSCDIRDASETNPTPCLCETDACTAFQFCNASAPENHECRNQYCKDYPRGAVNLCNRDEGAIKYGYGLVSPDQQCTDEHSFQGTCTENSYKQCCRECPVDREYIAGSDGNSQCLTKCDYSMCQDDWVPPPVEGAPMYYEDDSVWDENTALWTKAVIKAKYTEWTGYCEGETCSADRDLENCCVPALTCGSEYEYRFSLCNKDYHNGNINATKICDDFICTPEACCDTVVCECEGGEPRMGIKCSANGAQECERCDKNRYRDNGLCKPIVECTSDQYEYSAPLERLYPRVCKKLTECQDDTYVSKNETIRSARASSVVFNYTGATSDRECSPRRKCHFDEYQVFSPTIYQDRECAALKQCTPNTQYAQIQYDGDLAISDAVCTDKTVCNDTHYITFEGNGTADRQCARIADECAVGLVQTVAPVPGKINRKCEEPLLCETTQYILEPWTEVSQTVCKTVTECTSDQYEDVPPTPRESDRICKDATTCSPTQYQTSSLTKTKDRECTDLTVCRPDSPYYEYESFAPSKTQDRQCDACPDASCLGCMDETDCEFDVDAKIHDSSKCSGRTCILVKVHSNKMVPSDITLQYGKYYRFEMIGDTPIQITGIDITKRVGTSPYAGRIVKGERLYFHVPMNHTGAISYAYDNTADQTFKVKRDCVQEDHDIVDKAGNPECTSVCGEGGGILIKRRILYNVIGAGQECQPAWYTRPCMCVSPGECPENYSGVCVYENCKCPVPCLFETSSVWEPCDAACGQTGTMVKKITNITQHPKHDGTACPEYGDVSSCRTPPPFGECDCHGHKMDNCGVCGGHDDCIGCDGTISVPKKIVDRCGVCGGDGSSCLSKMHASKSSKDTRSRVFRIAVPLFLVFTVVGVLGTTLWCLCRKKSKRPYAAVDMDGPSEAFQNMDNIIYF